MIRSLCPFRGSRRQSGARSLHSARLGRFDVTFRYGSARYDIVVENPLGVCGGTLAIKLYGIILTAKQEMLIRLVDRSATYRVQLVLG